MPSFLQVENISKSYGEKVLFSRIYFNINEGDKIALIAPNGTGKTTLLSVLAGKDHSDSGGSVKFMKDISIAFLEQNYDYNPQNTIFQEVFTKTDHLYDVVKEYNSAMASQDKARLARAINDMDRVDGWSFEQKIKQILFSLQLGDLSKKMSELSGGEIKKVAIASILLKGADFLILDEPTNHLDIEIIEFLEDYLKKSKCTLFMVTHDRYFLDRVCNTIYELDGGELYTYRGSYSDFLEKREERIANMNSATDRARNLYRRELEWIRSTPCARTGKAKYRIDAFNDLKERAQMNISEDRKLNMNVHTVRLGTKIIECKHVNYSYGEQCMLNDFTYNFARFEKVGIVGGNGVGKSTFLNLMTGVITPDSGSIEVGETVTFGYYRQEGMEFIPGKTVFDIAYDIAETVTMEDGSKISASAFLNRFLFSPQMHSVKVEKLSGGERRRLYLLTVLMKNPNFLILDEPTNDLDILTLNVLEEYLQSFRGCVLIVSHDRYFLDKIADHIFIFSGDGAVKDYIGKCSEYREYIRHLEKEGNLYVSGETQKRGLSDLKGQAKNKISGNEKYRQEKRNSTLLAARKPSFKEQRELEQLEREMKALEEEKKKLEEALSSGNLVQDKLIEASTRIGAVIATLDEKETRWLELNE